MIAERYLALSAIFGIGAVIAPLVVPYSPILMAWNGSWAIIFRFLAKRSRWRRQREQPTED